MMLRHFVFLKICTTWSDNRVKICSENISSEIIWRVPRLWFDCNDKANQRWWKTGKKIWIR
jgi:hypothetical protein